MGRSDAELLEASRRGERDAFAALIERYQGVVNAVSYSRTGDRALSEDVAQDTFIAAWRQLGQLREPSRLRSWLCGIARNLARKARRRSAREAPLDHVLVFEGGNPFDHAAEAESERVVRDALMRVPDTYRDVLVLYYREQRSVRDVAAALGITEAAALQRLSRGRQYLADGVTDLVESSLRKSRGARDLAAVVLAALPALAPSRADAAPHPHGGNMIKIAIIATALAAAGTTAYVVHRPATAPAAVTAAAAAEPVAHAAPAAPTAARPASPAGAVAAAPTSPALPAAAAQDGPPDVPRIDRATIERLALHRGPAKRAGRRAGHDRRVHRSDLPVLRQRARAARPAARGVSRQAAARRSSRCRSTRRPSCRPRPCSPPMRRASSGSSTIWCWPTRTICRSRR